MYYLKIEIRKDYELNDEEQISFKFLDKLKSKINNVIFKTIQEEFEKSCIKNDEICQIEIIDIPF